MKRTLLEILGGLAVLVLMASFHQQIARLKVQQQDVADLRGTLAETVAGATSKDEVLAMREQISSLVDTRLDTLERQIAEAAERVRESDYLKKELDKARREASSIKAEVTQDVRETRRLVTTYQDEVRAQGQSARQQLTSTRADLERLTNRVVRDRNTLNTELIAPTVQLNGEDTVGSGTLIRSSRDARTGKAENYVITSYHVVRNILADTPRAKHDGILTTIYGRDGSNREVPADMISHDESIDAALLKLRTDETFDHVAAVLPRALAREVHVWDDIYAIGCPLGNDPIPTSGAISSTENVLNGVNYWMINAPTYYGNSGGGVYLADSRRLVGVFSKIYTHGRGTPVVIPHMGLCTPITSIYEWLDREKLAHVIPQLDELAIPDLATPPK